jgi:pyrroline-5-carboxylate reductase
MAKIGFIGYGNMGGTMLRALLKFGAIQESEVMVFTRTRQKLEDFMAVHPGVEVADSISDLGSKCNRVFICTGTKEVKPVLLELVNFLPAEAHLISITGTIEIRCLENIFKGRISKVMPTMISEVGAGVTLVCHNQQVGPRDKEFIRCAFGKIGAVKEIEERQIDLATDLTSCATAFYAAILSSFSAAAARHADFNEDELRELMLPTCLGTARLLLENKVDYPELISRVATKGGITAEGIKVLDSRLPEIFDLLLTVTLEKRRNIKQLMRQEYGIE